MYSVKLNPGINSLSHDVMLLAHEIHQEIIKNPDRHILTILEAVSVTSSFRNNILELIHLIKNPQDNYTEFPYNNLAYRALLQLVRIWKKKDDHVHVSLSVEPEWFFDEVKNKEAFYRPIFEAYVTKVDAIPNDSSQSKSKKARLKNEVKYLIMNYYLSLDAWSNARLEDILRIFYFDSSFELYTDREIPYDLPFEYYENPKNCLEIFIAQAKSSVRRFFKDGVRDVTYLFNPFKEYHSQKLDFVPTLEMLNLATDELETWANETFGGTHRVRFLFSLNQAKHGNHEKWTWIQSQLLRIIELKKSNLPSNQQLLSKVLGFDISGEERHTNNRALMKPYLRKLKQVGFYLTAHTGDRWNLNQADFDDNIQGHLKYLKNAITMNLLEVLGHANIVTLNIFRGLLFTKGIFIHAPPDHIRKCIELMDSHSPRGFANLPQKPFLRINAMKQNHFYFWKKHNLNIFLGVDGINHLPEGLSEFILQLMLCAPLEETVHTSPVSLLEMKQISSVYGQLDIKNILFFMYKSLGHENYEIWLDNIFKTDNFILINALDRLLKDDYPDTPAGRIYLENDLRLINENLEEVLSISFNDLFYRILEFRGKPLAQKKRISLPTILKFLSLSKPLEISTNYMSRLKKLSVAV